MDNVDVIYCAREIEAETSEKKKKKIIASASSEIDKFEKIRNYING